MSTDLVSTFHPYNTRRQSKLRAIIQKATSVPSYTSSIFDAMDEMVYNKIEYTGRMLNASESMLDKINICIELFEWMKENIQMLKSRPMLYNTMKGKIADFQDTISSFNNEDVIVDQIDALVNQIKTDKYNAGRLRKILTEIDKERKEVRVAFEILEKLMVEVAGLMKETMSPKNIIVAEKLEEEEQEAHSEWESEYEICW